MFSTVSGFTTVAGFTTVLVFTTVAARGESLELEDPQNWRSFRFAAEEVEPLALSDP